MKEHPILFKGEMVRAILEGRKTQTRRVIKNPDDLIMDFDPNDKSYGPFYEDKYGDSHKTVEACPYGVPGDRLWVRETFAIQHSIEGLGEMKPFDDGRPHLDVDGGFEHGAWWEQPHYRATDPAPDLCYDDKEGPCVRWKPSIHMPRWASRILLEVVSVRVERLQKISKKDALAEGVVQINKHFLMDPEELKIPEKFSNGTRLCDESYWGNDNPVGAFFTYFDKINGEDSFYQNPWVWVVEFKRELSKEPG